MHRRSAPRAGKPPPARIPGRSGSIAFPRNRRARSRRSGSPRASRPRSPSRGRQAPRARTSRRGTRTRRPRAQSRSGSPRGFPQAGDRGTSQSNTAPVTASRTNPATVGIGASAAVRWPDEELPRLHADPDAIRQEPQGREPRPRPGRQAEQRGDLPRREQDGQLPVVEGAFPQPGPAAPEADLAADHHGPGQHEAVRGAREDRSWAWPGVLAEAHS